MKPLGSKPMPIGIGVILVIIIIIIIIIVYCTDYRVIWQSSDKYIQNTKCEQKFLNSK